MRLEVPKIKIELFPKNLFNNPIIFFIIQALTDISRGLTLDVERTPISWRSLKGMRHWPNNVRALLDQSHLLIKWNNHIYHLR